MEKKKSNVIITHFVNPHKFYFRADVMPPQIMELMKIWQSLAANGKLGACVGEKCLEQNKLYAVRFQSWDKYIRAEVLHMLKPGPMPEYMMWAVDDGFPFTTTSRFIFNIPETFPPFQRLVQRGGMIDIMPITTKLDEFFVRQEIKLKNWVPWACEKIESLIDHAAQIEFEAKCQQESIEWGDLTIDSHDGQKYKIKKYLIDCDWAIHADQDSQDMVEVLEVTDVVPWIKWNGTQHYKENNYVNIPRVKIYRQRECDKRLVREWQERNSVLLGKNTEETIEEYLEESCDLSDVGSIDGDCKAAMVEHKKAFRILNALFRDEDVTAATHGLAEQLVHKIPKQAEERRADEEFKSGDTLHQVSEIASTASTNLPGQHNEDPDPNSKPRSNSFPVKKAKSGKSQQSSETGSVYSVNRSKYAHQNKQNCNQKPKFVLAEQTDDEYWFATGSKFKNGRHPRNPATASVTSSVNADQNDQTGCDNNNYTGQSKEGQRSEYKNYKEDARNHSKNKNNDETLKQGGEENKEQHKPQIWPAGFKIAEIIAEKGKEKQKEGFHQYNNNYTGQSKEGQRSEYKNYKKDARNPSKNKNNDDTLKQGGEENKEQHKPQIWPAGFKIAEIIAEKEKEKQKEGFHQYNNNYTGQSKEGQRSEYKNYKEDARNHSKNKNNDETLKQGGEENKEQHKPQIWPAGFKIAEIIAEKEKEKQKEGFHQYNNNYTGRSKESQRSEYKNYKKDARNPSKNKNNDDTLKQGGEENKEQHKPQIWPAGFKIAEIIAEKEKEKQKEGFHQYNNNYTGRSKESQRSEYKNYKKDARNPSKNKNNDDTLKQGGEENKEQHKPQIWPAGFKIAEIIAEKRKEKQK